MPQHQVRFPASVPTFYPISMKISHHSRKSLSQTSHTIWRRVWTRSTLTFIGFVVLAAAFWLAMSLNETYEVEITVPLELREKPDRAFITTDLPKELRVTIRDKGVRLLPYLYGSSLQPITVTFRDHDLGNGRGRLSSAEILGQLQRQITAPTQIVRVKPDTLEFYYNSGNKISVPVRFDGDIKCANGYFVSAKKLNPEFVTVYAPQSVLDTLRSVSIRPLNLNDVRDTVRRKQAIATPRGMKAVPAEVQVTIITDRLTEKTVQVPIHSLNFPAARVLRTFPSYVNVTFKVGVKEYERIGADKFVIALSYEDLLSLRSNKVRLNVRSLPDGVSDVRISPSTVDFVIETIPEDEDSI